STSFSSTSRAPTISGAHSVCRGVLPTFSSSAPPCQDENPLFAANVDESAAAGSTSGVNSVGMGSLSTSSSTDGTAAAVAAGSTSGVNSMGMGSLLALSSGDGTAVAAAAGSTSLLTLSSSGPQMSMDVAPRVAANVVQSAAPSGSVSGVDSVCKDTSTNCSKRGSECCY
ncbi:hypothetical protein MKW94_017157, partial [Papaver nudicaule]|nr:hypothetical protein [Papaver nudicaule]